MLVPTTAVICLLTLLQIAVGAPTTTADPNTEVELVPPLENSEVENEAANDATVVVVVGPGYDEYDQESFGFGELPSVAGSFGGFGGGLEEVKNIDLSNIFGDENDDPGITVSLSVEPALGLGQNSVGFSLIDLLSSISSGNQQDQSSFRNFGPSKRRQHFGSGIFGSINPDQGAFSLEGFLRRPQSSFLDIFGSQTGSLKPLVGLGDFIGRGTPQQSTSSLGVFSGLTGGPWTSFQSIFTLYNQPEVRGYREVFGPVYGLGGGCGLCQLFTSGTVSLEGAIVTIELVDHEKENSDESDYYHEVLEEEIIPGGTAVLLNETAIRVLDDNGEGIYFLLNTNPGPSKPEAGDTEGENANEDSDDEMIEDYFSADGEISQRDDKDKEDRNTPTEKVMIDQNTTPDIEISAESTTMEMIKDAIDDGSLEDSSAEENPDVESTTLLPAVFDAGRFDITNDKITVGVKDDVENSMNSMNSMIPEAKQ